MQSFSIFTAVFKLLKNHFLENIIVQFLNLITAK
nr:MAG TPA: hypothetical protein [Caudoviricetes sp.]